MQASRSTESSARAAAALPVAPRDPLRQRIMASCRAPESDCLPPLIAQARLAPEDQAHARRLAYRLVVGLRAARSRSGGVNALMKEFALSSQEGVALMCLAEALLRVPDRVTADRLICDKLAHGDWQSHLGHSTSLFVNAATWGLLVTGRLVATSSEAGLSNALTRLLARGGEPLIRKGMDLAMRMLGEQFVTGKDIDEALVRAEAAEKRGYRYSFDMLGEAAMTAADARRYQHAYETAIRAIGRGAKGRGVVDANGISVKLSALHPRYVWSQRDRVMSELLPRLKRLCVLAAEHDIGLNIDAEESDRLDLSLDLLEAVALDAAPAGWQGLGFVVQAYQKRAALVIDWLIDLARRSGRRIMVRLVKGAYWDAEIKRAQVDGMEGYPVYTRKVYTDVSYLACARKLMAASDVIYPQFATHNAQTLAAVMQLGGDAYKVGDYEFQCLHGMGEPLFDQILGDRDLYRMVRIYAPVGSHETLLAYLVRRLLENGANSSFVNRIVDARVPIDELIADPVVEAAALTGMAHPRIALPAELYGDERRNSKGFDLASEVLRERISESLQASREVYFEACPMVAGNDLPDGVAQPVVNPADRSDRLGSVVEAGVAEVALAVGAAVAEAPVWASWPPVERARCLDRTADRMEGDAQRLIALAVREAGKSWTNAVAELREAVDFLRYYAAQARGLDNAAHRPLGPVACISPWNFPLAIFTGQVAAALAAGNPVLAKPAEQTPLIAAEAVRMFHAAGVPVSALQLLPGKGELVGAALVADTAVRGVMFTGSTEVACLINRTLAARGGDVPLIAETGGQNAMIVDSTALPEQVVADVLLSSFDSAGQRCSALRVLCLQEEIADDVIEMLVGAAAELRVGNPADVRNDIGPVIDAEARTALEAHVARMLDAGGRLHRFPLSDECAGGTFVAPTLIEIRGVDELGDEQFGPILHVLRYGAADLDVLVDAINATGYGLTLGVHSRIDETIERIVRRARVGNIYVNRNMIGAVVGVQPFGGEGRSGTGPKAGGPLYLHRLLRQSPGPDLGHIERPSDSPPFAALVAWLDGEGRELLAATDLAVLRDDIGRYRSARLCGLRLSLPGPTGEDNSLRFEPRGVVVGLAHSLSGWIHQLVAALASGNRLVLPEVAGVRELVSRLPPIVASKVEVDAQWHLGCFTALLLDGPDEEADAWRERLAARDGPIVALLRPEPIYDQARLVHERTVSINTAAAGGNASLMALSG
jgi:RHH-type transcriptional regulator, proline utilization regulon repressor / proline dehydrogenase / delta 1-pyrroline-5-carboxylate dehydrogenase